MRLRQKERGGGEEYSLCAFDLKVKISGKVEKTTTADRAFQRQGRRAGNSRDLIGGQIFFISVDHLP